MKYYIVNSCVNSLNLYLFTKTIENTYDIYNNSSSGLNKCIFKLKSKVHQNVTTKIRFICNDIEKFKLNFMFK